MKKICLLALVVLACGVFSAAYAEGAEVILDTTGMWRMHSELRPPVIAYPGGAKAIPFKQKWLMQPTPSAPADWMAPDFDDHRWLRGTALMKCRTPLLDRMSLRGKFTLDNPKRAGKLMLSVDYHGGVVVYLNGKEIARKDLPDGPLTPQTLATPYPPEAFVTKEGDYLGEPGVYLNRKSKKIITEESKRRLKLRDRSLQNVILPGKLLRKGVNVLAVQIIRSAYDPVLNKAAKISKSTLPYELTWDTCELQKIRLVSSGGKGVHGSAVRPEGLQVWNSDPLRGDVNLDFGIPAETVRPIRIVGARNGLFTGKVVVGSTKPICHLKVKVGDFSGPGKIPASAVRVYFAAPYGEEQQMDGSYHRREYPFASKAVVLDKLLDAAPDKVTPSSAAGAVLPVWISVRVPADVAAGDYRGTLTLKADGEKPMTVPIALSVADWTLPDSQNFRTWLELMQSPDTLALEYQVPLWSEKHWALIAQSLSYLRDTGSRVLYVPLLAKTNLGNAESMVRWIEKGEEAFEWDFSLMDRYLDLAEKHMGKPKLVVFRVWEIYLIPKKGRGEDIRRNRRMVKWMDSNNGTRGLSPIVTSLDPKSGKTEIVSLPPYSVAKSKALWKPLMVELKKRLQKRGLEDAMMLGAVTDAIPTKQEVAFFAEVAPGVPWLSHGHGGFEAKQKLHGIADVGYQSCVWYTRFTNGITSHQKNWGEAPLYGWKQEQLTTAFERNTGLEKFPLTRWRYMGESNITGGQRGMGRLGLDYWSVLKDRRGRRRGRVYDRFPGSQWMNLNIPNAVLAPGPKGPTPTTRYFAILEGVQECEARIAIERALTDKKLRKRLGSKLVKRCENILAERARNMWRSLSSLQICGPGWSNGLGWRWTAGVSGHRWLLGSDWRKDTQTLFNLAGEVTRKLK